MHNNNMCAHIKLDIVELDSPNNCYTKRHDVIEAVGPLLKKKKKICLSDIYIHACTCSLGGTN